MRLSLTFCLLIAVAPSVRAEGAFEKALVTDRPDTAESSVTVGKSRFQIETGFAFGQDKASGVTARNYGFSTLFRFGLTDPLELRVEGDMFITRTETGMSTQSGFSDLAFGAKAHLLDNGGWTPSLGALFNLKFPFE
ncbi:MAG: transporter [Elusimicrobiota bacterium]